MLSLLFPGQGSQQLGMGKHLFGQFPEELEMANSILGYDLEQLCLHDPDGKLSQTQYTQPALFTVCALEFLTRSREENLKPDYAAGHSLGEYAALFAAGVFDFATGLALVQKRGILMSQAKPGAMAAIIGFERANLENFIQEKSLEAVYIANHNSHLQLVVSGSHQGVQALMDSLPKTQCRCIPLKVSGAFHSPMMEDAKQQFADYLQPLALQTPSLPVFANVNANIHHPAAIKTALVEQITHGVEWLSIMKKLLAKPEMKCVEVGPGHVLQQLCLRIQKGQ